MRARGPARFDRQRAQARRELSAVERGISMRPCPLTLPKNEMHLAGPFSRLHSPTCPASSLHVTNGLCQFEEYRHLDLATKFLYIEHRDGLTDLKKRDLDGFVKEFKQQGLRSRAATLFRKASATLDNLGQVFLPADPLLASVGMVTISTS